MQIQLEGKGLLERFIANDLKKDDVLDGCEMLEISCGIENSFS